MSQESDPSGRRRFLGTSLGATTALLAGWRPAPASAVGANDRIRVGIIGTGGRARGLMRQLRDLPGQEIVAVCDVYEPRVLEAAEIAGTAAVKIADYRRVLDDKDVHAVLIGAPDHWHKTMTLDALAAGKDVYVEKPVSHSIEEGAAMVAAVEGIGFVSLGVWAHHMFTVGMTSGANSFFALATMAVGIPTGIKLFNWLATLWGGKIRLRVPMLWCLGFLFQFLIAGLTGIMLAAVPFDWQVSDSYFVVAHFHYVLVGALVFAIFAAMYYWFPKATGKMLSETLGKWHFWLFVIGFHITFDTMHIPGLLGMPRRIYTYEADRGWALLNMICTVGVLFQAVAIVIFLWNVIRSLAWGKTAGNDPWDAWTLEWAVSSPPPHYNFALLPVVRSRRPLWDFKHPEDPDWKYQQ